MKKQLAASLILIAFFISMVSCVSSILKESPPTFSKNVNWSEPAQPFERLNTAVYPAWKSKVTGNVISIVSDCSNSSGPGLLGLHRLIENSIEDFKLIKEQKPNFQNQAALVRYSEGQVDGSPLEVQSMSFRRKECGYLTSLSGKLGNLENDRKIFQQFNEGLSF